MVVRFLDAQNPTSFSTIILQLKFDVDVSFGLFPSSRVVRITIFTSEIQS